MKTDESLLVLQFYVVCRFSSMHTVTNVFILALALADIAFLVNVPFLVTTSVLGDWPFGDVYCKMYVCDKVCHKHVCKPAIRSNLKAAHCSNEQHLSLIDSCTISQRYL